jgi:predicted nucleic acid-binding protein
MNVIFLDTVGLLSLWDNRDQWHIMAEKAFAEIQRSKASLITTNYVLLECGNAAARRPYKHAVDRLRQKLEKRGDLIFPNAADWAQAWKEYRAVPPGQAGIVDLISMTVMRRLEINCVFTNDSHFKNAGFEILF